MSDPAAHPLPRLMFASFLIGFATGAGVALIFSLQVSRDPQLAPRRERVAPAASPSAGPGMAGSHGGSIRSGPEGMAGSHAGRESVDQAAPPQESEAHGMAGSQGGGTPPGMPGMAGGDGGGTSPEGMAGSGAGAEERGPVTVDARRQQLIGLTTGKVRRGPLVMTIRTIGIVEPDQTRLAMVHTRVNGWITRVHADFIGQLVKKGDPLLDIYSPELVSTQQEYLVVSRTPDPQAGALDLRQSTRRRLELFGVPPDEIQVLEKTRQVQSSLTLRAPVTGRVLERNALPGIFVEPATELYRLADLSIVWVQARVYEQDQPHVEIGQPARITVSTRPPRTYTGRVAFIEPVYDETTRTAKVRIEVENPEEELKPGMFTHVVIEHAMGEGLLVPESALLYTGERILAFRAFPRGRFEPVEVKIGGSFKEEVQVIAGLQEGDRVVTSANFLIDSESRLKSASGMAGSGHSM